MQIRHVSSNVSTCCKRIRRRLTNHPPYLTIIEFPWSHNSRGRVSSHKLSSRSRNSSMLSATHTPRNRGRFPGTKPTFSLDAHFMTVHDAIVTFNTSNESCELPACGVFEYNKATLDHPLSHTSEQFRETLGKLRIY